MAQSENDNSGGWLIIATGLAIGLGLAGLGLGLALLISVIRGTILTIPWVIPVGSAAAAGSLAVGAIAITVNVYKKAVKEPYYWLIPTLAIFSGMIVDLCKDLYDADGPVIKAGFGAVTLICFIGGGLLWKKKVIPLRVIGSIMYLFPPLIVSLKYASTKPWLTFWEAMSSIPLNSTVLISLVLLLLLFLLSAYLAYYLRND